MWWLLTGILKAVFDGRESSRPLKADRAVRFRCWDNYLTAGTDEVSMGMVKRVLYTATWGSCRDPEAVSWSRNKSGGTHNAGTSSPN